ncbi:MAG: ATP-binding protein [Acidobacteria bacterium]|nr:ATP-binding protein [Acidobacteriota bacterium]
MSTALAHLRADLHSDAAALDETHRLIEELWDKVPLVPDRDRVLFSLAVAEIAANVIEHARGEGWLWELDLSAWSDRLEACIRHPGPTVEQGLGTWAMPEELADSGRGLALANAASSLRYFHKTDPEGNEWLVVRMLTS